MAWVEGALRPEPRFLPGAPILASQRRCYSTVYLYGLFVLLAVQFLRRRGRVLPWREVANVPPRQGDLRVEECFDEGLRRHVRMARLLDPGAPVRTADVPTLLDVRLIAMSPLAFSLTGFERIDGAEYAQSWLVTAR
jgi:hypothetical protein